MAIMFYPGAGERINSINTVKGYNEEQKKRIMEQALKDSEARQETREYLNQFQNPENYSFQELLDQAMGKATVSTNPDEDCYVLDIKS